MKKRNKMVSLNQRIVNLYNKMQATGKTDARRMNWIQTLARKAITGKLPRWGNNMSNTVPSYTANATKAAFTNIGNGAKPVSGILGGAEAVTLGGIADAVNIPYQGIKNLYNAGADFYNAGASNRNALLQEAILDRMQEENKDPFTVLDNPNTVYKRQQQIDANLRQQGWDAYNNGNLQGNPVNRRENQLTLDTGKVK